MSMSAEDLINFLYDRIDCLQNENIRLKELQCTLEDIVEDQKKIIDNQKKVMKIFNNDEVIKLMYNMYFNNYSFREIAAYLNQNKIPTRKGGDWNKSSIGYILKNTYNIEKFLNEDELTQFYSIIAKNRKNKGKANKE